MQISISKIPKEKEEKTIIECHEITPKINSIVKYIKSLQGTISGELEKRNYEIAISDIYYVESVDNKTYLYTREKVYSSTKRLYEIEALFDEASFLRISKAVVVNLMKIKSIKPALNGRFSAVLANGEEVIISRKYVPDLKKKIKGE